MNAPAIKPPLGVMPRKYWEAERCDDLTGAIRRYVLADLPIPAEWIIELGDLLRSSKARGEV